MMISGTNVNQRDIILIPFPYSDMSQVKKRPSIIVSNKKYNLNNLDVICCAVTSNPNNYEKSVEIVNKDLDSGELKFDSRVKPTKIFTLDKRMIIKKLAQLNIEKSKEIVENLNQSIEINEDIIIDIKK